MVHSLEGGTDTHPYWYTQVLGIYHTFVFSTHPNICNQSMQCMGFPWVHWLGVEQKYHSGPQYAHLPIVGFVEDSDDFAFRFPDPSLVICGCHLILRFAT